MASNLAGATCIGQHSVCIIRAASLTSSCAYQTGADAGWVSLGLITMTDSPEYDDDFTLAPLNGCGTKLYTVEEPGRIARHNLTGDLGYHDWEMMALLFGGSTIAGKGGGPYAGKVIGWAAPSPTSTAAPKSVYLEVITKNISASAGDCSAASGASGYPPYQGHIYGKVKLRRADRTFERDSAVVSFTGVATANPNLNLGPWGDWPGTTTVTNTIYQTVGYSQAQYDAIAATAGCGYGANLT